MEGGCAHTFYKIVRVGPVLLAIKVVFWKDTLHRLPRSIACCLCALLFSVSTNYSDDYATFSQVSYDESLWQSLIEQFANNSSMFTTSDRSSIINDAFSSARIGRLSYQALFNLTTYLFRDETAYVPLSAALSGFGYMHYTFR